MSVDTTQSTNTNRIKVYINGVLAPVGTAGYPSQNYDTGVNNAVVQTIGRNAGNTGSYGEYYLADVHFIDGQALTPTDFGETDDNSVWQPKKFGGTYTLPASGIIYSNSLVASNGGFHADPYGKDAGFNNTIGTGSGGYVQAANGSNPNNLTFTPASPITYSNSVEVYIINAANTVTVNGGSAQTISANQWVSVASGSGTLTQLKFERASTSGASFSGIKIDGALLVDGNSAQGANSFHLDFKDNLSLIHI